jgi:hypothetical protein
LCFQVNVCSVCNPSPPTILISLSKFHREKSKERKLPLSEETTLEFIHWLATDRKLSAGTISSYLAGIRQLHTAYGSCRTLGNDDEDIQALGRWSSRAFEEFRYLMFPRTKRMAIAKKIRLTT